MSKKLLLLLAPALLVLTACGGGDTAESQVTGEDSFIAIVRADGGPIPESATDSELLQLGYAACLEFSKGVDPVDMYNDLATTKESRLFLSSILAASKVFLCP